MSFTGPDIRTLRQRLGWSVAEMARQMGCTTELIAKWEGGVLTPETDAQNHLQYLQNYVESNSEHIAQEPLIEIRMEDRGLSQCTHRDLLKDN